MFFVALFSIFLSDFQRFCNQSQQPTSIINIRTGCDHISMASVLKMVINPQNNNFVINFDTPEILPTTLQQRTTVNAP